MVLKFFRGRTQQVRVNPSYSFTVDIVSGIMQSSVAGLSLYAVLIDSLLRKIPFSVGCFADDIKFVADVTTHTVIKVQSAIDEVVNWSGENYSPLSIDKCGILHCGDKQPMNVYYIKSTAVRTMDNFTDLSITRCTVLKHCNHHQVHYQHIVSKTTRVSGAVRCIFRSRTRELLWSAFQMYILPVLMIVLLSSIDSGTEQGHKYAGGSTAPLY